MGTCEESSPSLEIENEINLGVSSNGIHHNVVDDGDDHWRENRPTEVKEALVQQLERVELRCNGSGQGPKEEAKHEEEEEEEEEEEVEGKSHLYPLRPYAADCSFYMKNGTCKFGMNCRFNHPPKRVFQPVGDKAKGNEENNESVVDTGKIDCKYLLTPGGCKFGNACRYNHSMGKFEKADPELNFLGLPIRPTEKECTFYLRTGSCAYGANCRFHHPDPTEAKDSEPGNSLANGENGKYLRSGNSSPRNYDGEPLQSSGVSRGTSEPSNGIASMNSLNYAGMSSYHQALPQNGGWNQNQVTISVSTNKTPLPHQVVNFSKKSDPLTHYEELMQTEEFPVRPGQPDCDYFMKTGNCKFRSACRYNHPISRASKLRLPPLSLKGPHSRSSGEYPERPGEQECEYFMKTRHCKFKSACRYHHPRNQTSELLPFSLNEEGLPLRPGSKICRNYEQQGTCKYGQKCMFHHPSNSSSAVPVADQDHSSIEDAVATDLEPPVGNNVESDWGDGWVM